MPVFQLRWRKAIDKTGRMVREYHTNQSVGCELGGCPR
eukprot:CAMPEP_0118934184 /NCGR_PEP_ID=MMETSP1169-20130426/13684_1 /TAXON_ID=36882 /ORGANISM="Pyramimonas obovata, Strain CCMP722" /LENGTH=37 /DNA_ID= /DNA_START= /DNA_END= /DNA_ORIENTATION=